MNCQEFETVVHDLAGATDHLSPCQSGLAHAQACARCAALLLEALALRADLRSLAVSDSTKQAPVHVEAALRHAFQRSRNRVVRSNSLRRVTTLGAAVAAAAFVLFVIVMSGRHGLNTPQATKQRSTAVAALAPPLVEPSISGATSAQPPPGLRGSRPESVRERRPPTATGAEWATDFMPLTDSDDPTLLESGSLVRVILPRSALASFGLPVNPDQDEGSISADLVVDEAGMLRAIRLVR